MSDSPVSTALSLEKLGAILLSLTLVIAPHALHLPAWISALALAMILARLYLGYLRRPLPARWLLVILALICVAGVGATYRTLYGRDVGVALLTVMTALKLLEMSKPRDSMVVVLLAYFLMVTNFFYSQSIGTAVYMLGCLWMITATQVGLQYHASSPRLRQTFRHAAVMLLQGIPLMLVFFLLFPRASGPLWGLPQFNYAGRMGLSETMSPGDVSSLSQSDEIAFRVWFERMPDKPSQLYWRGPVLSEFDGRTWRPGITLTSRGVDIEALAPAISYVVTLEPHDKHWLFAIDLPSILPPDAYLTTDLQLLSKKPLRERRAYAIESIPKYRVERNLAPHLRSSALRLPVGFSPRAQALAQSWRAQSASDQDVLRQALHYFQTTPFFYTLEPPRLGLDPVDQFLFETRSGFCEHYASAFTFLMRAAGVPARVVTGYLGGEINPVDDYLVVRQSEAHAWSEVWLPNEGWVRVDPTATVSPLRIERGLVAAVPASDALPLLSRTQIDWIKQMRFALDAVANSWNQWVLGYSPERQVDLLSRLGFPQVRWEDLVVALILISAALLLLLAVLLLVRRPDRRLDPVQRIYISYCRAMGRLGMVRLASEGPRDFAARVAMQMPQRKTQARNICMLYLSLRYGSALRDAQAPDREKFTQFKQAVRELV
jgi:protein-glutamine gamma-glutamyltransferase